MKKTLTLLLILSIHNLYAADIYDPSDDLITAFGGTCSTQGYMTSSAMSQASSLRTIYNSIHNDPNCSTIAQSLDSLDSSLSNSIKAQSMAEQNVNNLITIIRDLKIQIAHEQSLPTPDANKIAIFQSELNTQEIALIRAKTDPALSAKSSQGRADAVNLVYNNATSLMSSVTDNNKCFLSHTTLAPQITSSTLQTLSLLAPTSMGASFLMAIPGIIGHLLQSAQDLRMTNNLKAAISAKMVHAIGCSIEGISSTYCQARDVRTILNAEPKQAVQTGCDVGLGVQVISKNLNAFQTWASTIVAGSAATSTAQADTKAGGLKAQNDFAVLKENLNGFVGQTERDLMGMKDPIIVKNRMKSLINDLTSKIWENSDHPDYNTKGTLGASFPDQCSIKAFIFSGGIERTCALNVGETPDAYIERKYPGVVPDVGQIRARVSTVIGEGQQYVSAKTATAIQSNAQLAIASSEHLGLNGKTAVNFLQDSRAYLANLLNNPGSVAKGNNKRIVTDAYNRVDGILKILDDATTDQTKIPEQVVSELAVLIAPSGDSNHIGNEVAAIVKSDIDSRIKNGKLDQNVGSILQLSTSDSLNEFINGNSNRAGLEGQISGAKSLTKSNLESFGNTFSDQIKENLESLSKDSKDDEDAKQTLGLMCVRLASLPQSPFFNSSQSGIFGGSKEIDISKYCKGQSFSVPKMQSQLSFDEIAKLPFNQRACSVYDFFRGSRLKEMSERPK